MKLRNDEEARNPEDPKGDTPTGKKLQKLANYAENEKVMKAAVKTNTDGLTREEAKAKLTDSIKNATNT